MAKKYIGVDIGSSCIRIYEQGKGVTVKEDTVAAVSAGEKEEYVACGNKAHAAVEKRPGALRLARPVRNGAVVEYETALKIMTGLFEKLTVRSFDALVSVHAGLDESAKSILCDLVRAAGAESAAPADASAASAVGAELDVKDKNCVLVCDIGSGVCEISVVSGAVGKYSKLIEYGGDSLDEAVSDAVKQEYGTAITAKDAKMLREKYCFDPEGVTGTETGFPKVRGLDVITGLPVEIEIDPGVVYDSVYEISDYIAQNVKYVLEGVGEEIADQIRQRGILLSGGASRTAGIDELIEDAAGVKVIKVPEPENCVIEGLGTMIENMNVFEVMFDFK